MFRHLALTSTTQPLSKPVPGEAAAIYLNHVGYGKAVRRAASRRLSFWLSGQDRFRLDRIPAGARRILWIYFGENQIGDALMDLASRSLLSEAGLQVDLFTSPLVATLFQGDPWFARGGQRRRQFRRDRVRLLRRPEQQGPIGDDRMEHHARQKPGPPLQDEVDGAGELQTRSPWWSVACAATAFTSIGHQ